MQQRSSESGSTNPLLVSSILLGLLAAGLAGFSAWSFTSYLDYKNNVDGKVAAAVTKAESAQAQKLEKDFVEREKQPYIKFNGPDDLGHLTFDYPKTWSVYIAKNGSAGDFEAYLNPNSVPAVTATQPYATRVIVDDRPYDTVLKSYESLVKSGKLKSSPITVNGFTGIRLDGAFSAQREGSSVLFKVRDKTLIVSTDASAFRADFDTVVVKSLDFNP